MSQHLIIENKAVRLKLEGKALNIVYPDRKPASIPLRMLEQLTLVANIEIQVQLLHKLAQHGVSVGFINSRNPEIFTECINQQHGEFKRREKQYALIHSPSHRLHASRQLVFAKLQSQSQHLLQLSQQRHSQRRLLLKGQQAIECLFPALHDASYQQLLGLEGTAARLYFNSFTGVFSPSWDFTGRNKRPPKDPVNALLSLGYTMLTREASRALYQAGLDPAFGFYHKVSSGRHSLACDLAELYRCQIDHLIFQLLDNGKLSLRHFGNQLNACLLTKEGRNIFFPAYQTGIKSCRRALRLTAHRWAKEMMAVPLPDWISER